jgi:MYXO-CTERM domain-containing protein
MAKDNDDCSETNQQDPNVVAEETATTARLYSFEGCNGNGRDDAWINEVVVTRSGPTSFSIQKTQDFSIEANEERTRGTMLATADPTLAVACWTAGNTQPPNQGVRCAGLDTTTAQANLADRLLWRQYLMRREDQTYRTQIRIGNVIDNTGAPTSMAIAEYEEIQDPGRRRGKGAAERRITAVNFTRTGMDTLTVPSTNFALGADVTHGTITSGLWGVDGQASSAIFGLYSSVIGQPGSDATMAVYGFNATDRTLVEGRQLSTGAAIDNAWIPNIYGNNPNNQGRNYNALVTGIRNPGYQQVGGFRPDVKLFAGIPASTRRIRQGAQIAEDKLAAELVLIPQVVAPAAPVDPDPVNELDPQQPVDPTNPDIGGGGGGGALGGCSVNGPASGSFLALLGLAFLVVIRRRK